MLWRQRDPSPDGRSFFGRSARRNFDVRLLFYEVEGDSLHLDCIAYDGFPSAAGGGIGRPVSAVVAKPQWAWLPAALTTLDRWVAEDSLLHVLTRSDRLSPRWGVSDGFTTMTLDLDPAASDPLGP